jgi:[NiFe] hydrogenase diaphorase moiety large subunit
VIVFGPGRDMLDVAKNFLEFFVEESCGQCTPCRVGNAQAARRREMLKEGAARGLPQRAVSLGETMQVPRKCGLGQSSPNAFLSIVEHFRDEIMGRMPPERSAPRL